MLPETACRPSQRQYNFEYYLEVGIVLSTQRTHHLLYENNDSRIQVWLTLKKNCNFSKSSAHDEEMRRLYEEMELQINAEKQRILQEVETMVLNASCLAI
jgi:hypothetical protein